jgi:predicted ArsR family transcriptional regulator
MLSIYEQTKVGQGTRSKVLAALKQSDGLTRNELVAQSGLTYEQIRRQTRNLVIAGLIEWRDDDGIHRYYLKQPTPQKIPALALFLLIAWLPVLHPTIETDCIRNSVYSGRNS